MFFCTTHPRTLCKNIRCLRVRALDLYAAAVGLNSGLIARYGGLNFNLCQPNYPRV